MITLAESGGANLNYAAEIFVEGARSFANQARMSAMGLPQITVVTARRRRAAPISRGCRTMWWWCVARPSCSWPARLC